MTMTVPSEVQPWVERLARVGFAATGVVYLLIGVLAFQAAAGLGGGTTDHHGALLVLLRQPLGRWLLAIVAAGLLGYAVWRGITAVADPEAHGRHDWKRKFVRVGFAFRAVVHVGLAWSAAKLALGNGGGAEDSAESRTAQLMSLPFGTWLVGAVAIGVGAYGIAQIVRGLLGKIDRQLALGSLGADERRLVERAARVGLVARGVVFGIIGVFLGNAALQHDPSEAGGLKEALLALEQQQYAPFLMGGVAVGLAAYGAYQLARARYRVISAA
jgi:hypothetical protein